MGPGSQILLTVSGSMGSNAVGPNQYIVRLDPILYPRFSKESQPRLGLEYETMIRLSSHL